MEAPGVMPAQQTLLLPLRLHHLTIHILHACRLRPMQGSGTGSPRCQACKAKSRNWKACFSGKWDITRLPPPPPVQSMTSHLWVQVGISAHLIFVRSVFGPICYEDVVHVWLHTICSASLPVHRCSMYETMYEGVIHVKDVIYVKDVIHVWRYALCCVRPSVLRCESSDVTCQRWLSVVKMSQPKVLVWKHIQGAGVQCQWCSCHQRHLHGKLTCPHASQRPACVPVVQVHQGNSHVIPCHQRTGKPLPPPVAGMLPASPEYRLTGTAALCQGHKI